MQFANAEDSPYVCGGNVWQALRLALPLLATSFIFCLIGVVDMAVAGWHGAAAQAAVGVADQVIFVTVLIGTGLAAATACFVSQSVGANKPALVRRFALDGIGLAALFGVISTIVCFFGADVVLRFTGSTPAVHELGLPYLQLCALGNLPFMVVLVQAAVLRALGKTSDCLRIWSVIGLLSIGGTLPLYFMSVFPTFKSLTSLAAAWDIGAYAGVLYGGALLFPILKPSKTIHTQPEHGAPLHLNTAVPSLIDRLGAFSKVAIPVLLSEGCYIVSLFSIYAVLGKLADSQTLQAAYSITLKIEETFGILPLVALSSISATLVGQGVGASQLQRARNVGWHLACVSAAIMVLLGAFVQVCSNELSRLFSSCETLISYVCIGTSGAAFTLPLIAFATVLFASLEGAGNAKLPFAAQFVGYVLCRIPLAFALAVTFEMGFPGVWVAILISRIAMAATAALFFHRADLSSGRIGASH